MPKQLQQGLDNAQAALTNLLRGYLENFQDYIGETGEIALAAVLGVVDAAASGEEGLLNKRDVVEKVGPSFTLQYAAFIASHHSWSYTSPDVKLAYDSA